MLVILPYNQATSRLMNLPVLSRLANMLMLLDSQVEKHFRDVESQKSLQQRSQAQQTQKDSTLSS